MIYQGYTTMHSRENLQEIDVHKYWLVLHRRWLPALGVFGCSFTFMALSAMMMKPTYKAEGSLLIQSSRTSSLIGLDESRGKLDTVAWASNPLDTQASIATSLPVVQETIRTLGLKDDKDTPIKVRDFLKNLKVEGAKGADVLQVSYKDKNPELAAQVVNKIINIYIRSNIQTHRLEAASARKFILEQLPVTEKAVAKAESELRLFKEKYRVVVLQEEASAAVKAISTLEEQITQARSQLRDVMAKSQKLQNEADVSAAQAVNSAELSQASGTQNVLKQLQEAQSQLVVEQTRLQPTHPTVINLQEKVMALQNLLNSRVEQVSTANQPVRVGDLQLGELRQKLIGDFVQSESERLGLEQRIAELSNAWTFYKQRAQTLPKLEQTQRELERKLKAAQTTYETLLTQLQEIQVTENQNVGNARIMSPAMVPDKPDGPRKLLLLAGGGVISLLLGGISALALDLIDRSVKTAKEARELFGYTVLGVIPSRNRNITKNPEGLDRTVPLVIGRGIPQFPIGDIYQMLQANLKFLSSDKQMRAIVITSSVSSEGKSEVSANLAVAMAQVGHRVLLVDADMRYPFQHHIWNLTNQVGLSNILVEQVSFDMARQEVMRNLDVLTSGVMPPSPIALIDSNRMAAFIKSLKLKYDYVVFDTPPVANTADAAVLGKLADGILLVVRPGVVDADSANAAKEFLTQSNQQVLGMVINGVNVKHDRYSGYGKESNRVSVPDNSQSVFKS